VSREEQDAFALRSQRRWAKAHAAGIKIGICGQAPSNYPEFAGYLVECGIDSISLNPDSFVAAARHIAAIEQQLEHRGS